jgi:tetratricopeptide (TPR) repeat protein
LEIKAKLAIEEKGDFSVAEKAVAVLELSSQSPELQAQLAAGRINLFFSQRKYQEALQEAEKLPDAVVAKFPGALCGKYTTIGMVKKITKDEVGARTFFLRAKSAAEEDVKQDPTDANAQARLGQALAWLGEKDLALATIQRAMELLPESKDAFGGPDITNTAAEIHAILGDASGAVALLEGLLRRPSPVTVALLKTNPLWDPIRSDPGFQALLK